MEYVSIKKVVNYIKTTAVVRLWPYLLRRPCFLRYIIVGNKGVCRFIVQSIIMVQHADNCSNFNIIDALLDKNLFHLVEDIFVRLDSQSLTNAENSSNHWSQFIQLSGRLYRKKMATISSWLFIKPEPEVAVLNRKSAVVSKKSNRHSIFIRTVSS